MDKMIIYRTIDPIEIWISPESATGILTEVIHKVHDNMRYDATVELWEAEGGALCLTKR